MNSFAVCFLAVVAVLTHDGAVATSTEDRLRASLLRDYDKTQHPNNDVVLTYDIAYRSCPTLDTATETLTSEIQETQQWTDDRLDWNRRSYAVRRLSMSPDDIWTPGVLIDSSSGGQELSAEEISLTLTSRGDLHRNRKLRVSSKCDQIGRAWKCQLRFVAWKSAGPNFYMETQGFQQQIRGCDEDDVKIEEYSAHVEEVGGIGNAYYHYVIDMVIESQ